MYLIIVYKTNIVIYYILYIFIFMDSDRQDILRELNKKILDLNEEKCV